MADETTGSLDDDVAPLPHGWTRLGPHSWATPFVLRVGSTAFAACYFVILSALQLFRHLPWPLAIVLPLVFLAIMAASVFLFANLRYPQPWVNFDTGEIRTGRRTASFSRIDSAWLFAVELKKTRVLTFRFGVSKGPQVVVRLRDAKDQLIDPETTRLLVAVLERSNVRMPVSKDDPSGRFARYNRVG